MSEWLPLIGLAAAAAALQAFMRYVWPHARRRLAGAREPWALRHGYAPVSVADAGEAIERFGRPGLFGWHRDGRIEAALRGRRVMLVDFSFVVTHGDAGEATWTERRQVSVAVGDVGVAAPRVRIHPRNLSRRIAALFLPTAHVGDPVFDRVWQVSGLPDAARLLHATTEANVASALRAAFALDEPAGRRLLTPAVRAAMGKYPKYSYEFEHAHLLVYRDGRLLSNAELPALAEAWNEVAGAVATTAGR